MIDWGTRFATTTMVVRLNATNSAEKRKHRVVTAKMEFANAFGLENERIGKCQFQICFIEIKLDYYNIIVSFVQPFCAKLTKWFIRTHIQQQKFYIIHNKLLSCVCFEIKFEFYYLKKL